MCAHYLVLLRETKPRKNSIIISRKMSSKIDGLRQKQ